jgi:hypothetical protein
MKLHYRVPAMLSLASVITYMGSRQRVPAIRYAVPAAHAADVALGSRFIHRAIRALFEVPSGILVAKWLILDRIEVSCSRVTRARVRRYGHDGPVGGGRYASMSPTGVPVQWSPP